MSTESIQLSANATLASVRLLAAAARGVLSIWPLSDERRALLELAIVEASTNVVRHAYAGRAAGPLVVALARDGETLRLSISDRGLSFDPHAVPPLADPDPNDPDTWPEHGLGLPIIRAVSDTLTYLSVDGENTMTLTVRAAGRAA